MSRRVQQKVMKYALVKFACDNKTLQMKTNEIIASTPLRVHAQVQVPWDGKRMKATILGLSDDQTDLNEVERNYMATLKKQNRTNCRQKKSATQTKTSSLLQRAKSLKRNEKRIEFLENTHTTSASKRLKGDQAAWGNSVICFTAGELDKLNGGIDGIQSSSSSFNNPSHTSLSLSPISPTAISPTPISPTPTPPNLTPLTPLSTSNISPTPIVLLNMDTHEITSSPEPCPSSLIPIAPERSHPLSPFPLSQVTDFWADDMDTRGYTPGLSTRTLDDIYDRLEDIFHYIRQLDVKLEKISSRPTTNVHVCSTSTQTDLYVQPPPIPEDVYISTDSVLDDVMENIVRDEPDASHNLAEEMITQDCPDVTDAQERFWKLTPSVMDDGPVTPELLRRLTSCPPKEVDENKIGLSPADIETLQKKSSSAGHFAKNIMYNTFSMKELHGKNASGKNFTGQDAGRKTALNPIKLRQIIQIVGLRYNEANLEKTVTTSVNSALRYLFNKKLRHQPWQNL